MKHGNVVSAVGLDARRRGVMKPSKVVFHKLFINLKYNYIKSLLDCVPYFRKNKEKSFALILSIQIAISLLEGLEPLSVH